jgi:2-polyprenyl-6-hydroxyphenyl methylase/3-demethylubiquinone-9 3-methyltransferase
MSDFNHFKYEWFDPYGPFAPLYHINEARLAFLKKLNFKTNTTMLDIGCGAGIATNKLHTYFPSADIYGLDASKNAIQLAKQYAQLYATGAQFIHQSALSPIEKKFDVILCFELIEHLDSPEALIDNCCRSLNKNGIFVLSTLDRSMISFIQNILLAEDLLDIIEPGTHDFNQFLRPSEINTLVSKHNLNLFSMSGLYIDPLTYEVSLNDNHFANYIMAFRKD